MDNQPFLCKKISMSAFSGRIRDLSGLIVSPAVENTLSDGVEDAQTHRWDSARPDSRGKVSLWFHHQRVPLFVEGIEGRLLYNWTS